MHASMALVATSLLLTHNTSQEIGLMILCKLNLPVLIALFGLIHESLESTNLEASDVATSGSVLGALKSFRV